MSENKKVELLIYRAKLAEQSERYEDMVSHMETAVKDRHNNREYLAAEERNLLSVAYKNVVGSRRAAWRITSSIEQKETTRDTPNAKKVEILKKYRKTIEKEMDEICENILNILDQYILYQEIQLRPECEVFYNKMKGDYCRYMAEYKSENQREGAADRAHEAYKEAQTLATADQGGEKEGLKSTHPIRLGLALNYSVFHYEILHNPDEACKLAKKAFDEAISELDSLEEDSYKDSTLIMQLLRDNLTLWTSDMQDESTGEEPTGERS